MPDADRVEVIFPASASDRIRTCHLSYRSIFGRSNSPEKMGKLPYYQLSAIRIFCQHKSATYSVQNGICCA